MHRRTLLTALAAALLVAPAPSLLLAQGSAGGATIVLVVRHAEKASDTDRDPPLSAAGEARAQALAPIAREAGVSAIFTTQFVRTKATAAPAAAALGVTPEVIEAGRDVAAHAKAFADAIRAKHAGKTVLVVGHSNTVNAIVNALGGPRLPDVCDAEYDNLFTVVIDGAGSRLVRSKYGAATPGGAACAGMAPR